VIIEKQEAYKKWLDYEKHKVSIHLIQDSPIFRNPPVFAVNFGIAQILNNKEKTCFEDLAEPRTLGAMTLAPIIPILHFMPASWQKKVTQLISNAPKKEICVEDVKNDLKEMKDLFYPPPGQTSKLTQFQKSAEHYLRYNKNAPWYKKAIVFAASVLVYPFEVEQDNASQDSLR
jgi:hypothetical protein